MKRLAVALALLAAVTVHPAAQERGRILVMPFDTPARDSRIFWLGEASAVLLTDDLTALGANAITRSERLQAFEQLQVPPAAALTDATVIRIGQLLGAERVVLGSLSAEGDQLIARSRSIALESGRVDVDVTERGPMPELFATIERIARRMAPSARTSEEVERLHPPVAAFETYIKGLLAETPATAIGYLQNALKLAPSFDRARLALWDVYTDEGEHDEALAAVLPAAADTIVGRRARFLAGLSQMELEKYDAAFSTFKQLADSRREAPVLNNLGVIVLRRGAGAAAGAARASEWFTQAIDADPDDADYRFNLGYAYWLERDPASAVRALREAVRRQAADGVAHYLLGLALVSSGSVAEGQREKELARRLSSDFAQWDKRPATDPVPHEQERVKRDLESARTRGIRASITVSEQRDQQEVARFHLDSGRRLYEKENDREAVDELSRAIYLSPYLAEAHLLLGRIHLRNGRVHEAIDAFKISLWSAESAEGHAALGEAFRQDNDAAAARAEAERALAMSPDLPEARALLARLDGR